MKLRDYQGQAIQSVIDNYAQGIHRQLISLPTGSGKTVIMAAIIQHFGKKTLLLAHRDELIEQANLTIKTFWPEANLGVCKGKTNDINHQIVIGSIQTCTRPKRLEQLKEQEFELLLIDEAHHSSATTYQRIVSELGFLGDVQKLLIGVTATPYRADDKELGNTFQEITFSKSISSMIREKHLCPVIGRRIQTGTSLKGIKTHMGDFAIGSLAHAINTPERNQFIAQKFKVYAPTRKAVAFCADVQHCFDLAGELNKHGIQAAPVWGEMKAENRKNLLKRFKNNHIQVLTSCGVLTEGFDEPTIECIAMCRPTKSVGLYTQCVGRGLRQSTEKKDCLVLDFADNRHRIKSIVKLKQAIPSATMLIEDVLKEDETSKEIQPTIKPPHDIFDIANKEFDVFETECIESTSSSRLLWTTLEDDEYSLADDHRNEIVISPQGDGYIAHLYFTGGGNLSITDNPITLEDCFVECELFAERNLSLYYTDPNSAWFKLAQNKSITNDQKEILINNGAYVEGMSMADASVKIRQRAAVRNQEKRRYTSKKPATEKQKNLLMLYGINPSSMSVMDAMHTISKLKQRERA